KYGREKNGVLQIKIALTQGDIADLVGASRKRVNQVIVSFKEQGLISVDGDGKIAIVDKVRLARYLDPSGGSGYIE
ncbi:MAG: helix-turn-helix domain-containing protein, partial [Chloroflexota bacterium]